MAPDEKDSLGSRLRDVVLGLVISPWVIQNHQLFTVFLVVACALWFVLGEWPQLTKVRGGPIALSIARVIGTTAAVGVLFSFQVLSNERPDLEARAKASDRLQEQLNTKQDRLDAALESVREFKSRAGVLDQENARLKASLDERSARRELDRRLAWLSRDLDTLFARSQADTVASDKFLRMDATEWLVRTRIIIGQDIGQLALGEFDEVAAVPKWNVGNPWNAEAHLAMAQEALKDITTKAAGYGKERF